MVVELGQDTAYVCQDEGIIYRSLLMQVMNQACAPSIEAPTTAATRRRP
jgi:hypothetical protein